MGKNTFSKALRENQKRINVKLPGSDEEIRLVDATERSVEGISATPIDAMMPITAPEILENADTDLPYLAIRTSYTESVFSLYEMGIKSPAGRKQTIVVPLTLDAADDLWGDANVRLNSVVDILRRNTNIALIVDKFPKKVLKRVSSWADDEESARMFVIRIPNILMFHENVVKKQVATPFAFDLVIVITNTKEKSLRKAKKRDKDTFDKFSEIFVRDIAAVLENFAISSVHFPLWGEFYRDPYVAAHIWAAGLAEKKTPVLKRVIFATPDPEYLICFNQEAIRTINNDEGNGMRVV